MNIIFNAHKLAAVSLAVSTEEARYYLNGIHIEPAPYGGAIAVATDGHKLIAAYDAEATIDGDSAIMPFSKRARMAAKGKKAHSVTFDGSTLTVACKRDIPLHIEVSKPIDGTFPDWRRTIPEVETVTDIPAAFNGHYIADLATAAQILGAGPFIRAVSSGPHDAALVYLTADAFAVIMPVRKGALLLRKAPDWAAPPA